MHGLCYCRMHAIRPDDNLCFFGNRGSALLPSADSANSVTFEKELLDRELGSQIDTCGGGRIHQDGVQNLPARSVGFMCIIRRWRRSSENARPKIKVESCDRRTAGTDDSVQHSPPF